jgi:antitoxin FitA
MASITIRNLDDELKARLRVRAAHHQRSMEDEVRQMLRAELMKDMPTSRSLAEAIQRRFNTLGGVDIALAPREAVRTPPKVGA